MINWANGSVAVPPSSTDFQTWMPELTTPGNGNDYSTNLTLANPRRFYRLSLTPN